MHPFLLAARTGWFAEGRFLGKVLDEWIIDAQEFIRTKLPHLVLVAIIAFVLNRLLRIIAARMIYVAEQHAAGQIRVSQVKTLAGVIRTTGLAIIANRRNADSGRIGRQSCTPVGFGGGGGSGHWPGGAEYCP